jgi:c-di-GMP-binding flagellar brake protein YcgR
MKQQATFTNWDFTLLPVWEIVQNTTYPYFNYQVAPDAPVTVIAVAGNGQATISFNPPANTGGGQILSYTVTSSPGSFTATGGSSPLTVTGLTNGVTYTFTVTATNANGTSISSATSNAVTPATVPGAPTIGTATRGNGQATVTFSAPASNGGSTILYYTVSSNVGGFTATGGSSPITITGLTNGQAYTFTVTATNAVGTSTPSATTSSVTPATVPDAPIIGTATRGNGQATVTFTPPVSNGGDAISYYTVSSNIGGFTATGGSSPITITGLTNGQAYTFTVTATNAVGTSTPSATTNSVTPAARTCKP